MTGLYRHQALRTIQSKLKFAILFYFSVATDSSEVPENFEVLKSQLYPDKTN